MRTSGTTGVFLVLADPVARVRAPQLCNLLLERGGAGLAIASALTERPPGSLAVFDADAARTATPLGAPAFTIPTRTRRCKQLRRAT